MRGIASRLRSLLSSSCARRLAQRSRYGQQGKAGESAQRTHDGGMQLVASTPARAGSLAPWRLQLPCILPLAAPVAVHRLCRVLRLDVHGRRRRRAGTLTTASATASMLALSASGWMPAASREAVQRQSSVASAAGGRREACSSSRAGGCEDVSGVGKRVQARASAAASTPLKSEYKPIECSLASIISVSQRTVSRLRFYCNIHHIRAVVSVRPRSRRFKACVLPVILIIEYILCTRVRDSLRPPTRQARRTAR